MIKILVVSPNPIDATSWYRTWEIFKNIRRRTDYWLEVKEEIEKL